MLLICQRAATVSKDGSWKLWNIDGMLDRLKFVSFDNIFF